MVVLDNDCWKKFSELRDYVIPKAAKMLKCSTDDIAVLTGDLMAFVHNASPSTADFPVKDEQYGAIDGLPIIQSHKLHIHGQEAFQYILNGSYGIRLYECRENRALKYVVHKYAGNYSCPEILFLLKKNEVFKIVRQCQRNVKKGYENVNPPILEDGMMDDIINHSIGFLKHKKEIKRMGVKASRGIILTGEPGNGKSMCCRYIQKLCIDGNLSHGVITSSDIQNAYTNNELNQLFGKYDVSFFDDIDISYMNRSAGDGKLACSLLAAMDGMNTEKRDFSIRFFTTNEDVDSIDEAFVRPGRIDRIIHIGNPSFIVRRKIVELWPEEIRNGIDVTKLVKMTNGCSCADLEAIRTFLVTEYFSSSNKKWDLELAMDILRRRKEGSDRESKVVGFSAGNIYRDKRIGFAAAYND